MQEFQYKNNQLWCESVSLKDAAEKFGTPLYVYSKRSVIDHCRHIEKAFGAIDHLSCYAVKANANRELLNVIAAEGIGADVGSLGELRLALDAGFPSEKITYSGVGKRDDEIEFALQKNILSFNVESEQELCAINDIARRLNVKARILLRVNFDIEAGTHPYVSTGKKSDKFGVEASKAKEFLKHAQSLSHTQVLGIHTHLGSQITSEVTFLASAKRAAALVTELRKSGIPIQHLNFGGGFGVQYRDYIEHPQLPKEEGHAEVGLTTVKLLEAALPILKETKCKILIQPGRSIVAHAGILLTKVLYRKETDDKKFVIVDAGMNDLIRPSLYQSYHQIVPLRLKETQHETVDVVGPLCESGDFFALDRKISKVERGEYLAIMCAGAYGYVLSSNYNARPRPAEVLVDGSNATLIRKRESLEQL